MTTSDAATSPADRGHVLVYADNIDRAALIRPWIRHALAGDDRVIYPARIGEPFEDALGMLATDVQQQGLLRRALESGQLQMVPVDDFYPPGKVERLAEAARADGFPRVRMVGDADTALAVLGRTGYERLEQQFEALCSTHDVIVLCFYDPATVPLEIAQDHIGLHRDGLQSAILRLSTSPEAIAVLQGEIDAPAAPVVEGALRHLLSLSDGPVARIDLSDLIFCDVAGVRALLLGTAEARSRGRSIHLVQPTAIVHRTLTMFEVPDTPGFRFEGKPQ